MGVHPSYACRTMRVNLPNMRVDLPHMRADLHHMAGLREPRGGGRLAPAAEGAAAALQRRRRRRDEVRSPAPPDPRARLPRLCECPNA
eukprot:1561183-Prymnesium_polylepis.1